MSTLLGGLYGKYQPPKVKKLKGNFNGTNTNNVNDDDSIFTKENIFGSALGLLADPNLGLVNKLFGISDSPEMRRAPQMNRILEEMERQKQTTEQQMRPEVNLAGKFNAITSGENSAYAGALNSAAGASANRGQTGGDTYSPAAAAARAAVAASDVGSRISSEKANAYSQYAQEQGQKDRIIGQNLAMQTDNADRTAYIEKDKFNLLDSMMKGNLTYHDLLGLNRPKSVDIA